MPDDPMSFTERPGSREGVEILSLSGPFTLGNMFELQRVLQQKNVPYLIFDLATVPYMDSAGLGLLVNSYVSAQKNGRKIAVAGATPRILTLFEITRVDKILPLFPTTEAAEASA